MSALRYFMWPWQQLFQDAAAHITQRLVRHLNPQLGVDAFLVGFRAHEEAAGTEDICVSPEDCRFRPEAFVGAPDLVEQLVSDDPRYGWRCSAPSSPDQYRQMALDAAWPKAVEQTLTTLDEKSVFFASVPVFVNGYAVLVVVQADRARYETHYRLSRDFVQKVQIRYSVGRSLIETTIRAYLDSLTETLQRPEPGRDIRLIGDESAVWRAAAKQLMRGPAWAGGDLMGLGDIYDVCNTISLQNYEGAEGAGQLVFVRKDHPSIEIDLNLRTPVLIYESGAVRKLLQMGSGRLCLFCDSRVVYGLGTVGEYDGASEDLFVVRFLKRFTWELVHAGHVMMHCREGSPQLRSPCPSPEPIREVLQRVFHGKNVDHLIELGMSVAKQQHGAMLVVTPSAAEEAVRLAKQAIVVEPSPSRPS